MAEAKKDAQAPPAEETAGLPATQEPRGGEVGPPAARHYDKFRMALLERKGEFAAALVGWMQPDHFIEVLTTAYLNDDKLWHANPVSLYQACRKAALLNLRPDGEEGYLEVYYDSKAKENRVAFQPMYKGLVRTLTRGGTVLRVDAQVVRSGDQFDYQLGDDPYVRHKPEKDPEKRGEIIFAYAIFWLANGLKHREVMSREEMDEIRENAKKRRPEGPAWRTNPDQMFRKMPIKRGVKFLDLNPQQAAVFRYDDAVQRGQDHEPADDIPEAEFRTLDERADDAAKRTVDNLKDAINQAQARGIAGQRVGFGKHREMTWAELHEKLPGYITHYVLTDDCPWVEEEVKASLRTWLGINGDEPAGEGEVPDPEAIKELAARGQVAIGRLNEAGGLDADMLEKLGAEVGLLAEDKNFFALQDVVDELERRADAASANGGATAGAQQV